MKVGVTTFTFSDENDERYVSAITERVLSIIQQTNRFLVIDLTSPEAREVALEKAAQNWNKDWDSDDIIDPAKGLNAVYTISGEAADIKFIKLTSTNPNGYKATVPITLKIMETETGSVISSRYFEATTEERRLTPQEALNATLAQMVPSISDYIRENFPLKLMIARLEEEKKGKARKVIINGGAIMGIEKGNSFEVDKIDRSLGSPLPSNIGRIRVAEVLNEKFSICSVTSGGEEILKAMNAKEEIMCTLIKD